MTKQAQTTRKLLALLLAGCLCFFGVPAIPLAGLAAYADEVDEAVPITEDEVVDSEASSEAEAQPEAGSEPAVVPDPEPEPEPEPESDDPDSIQAQPEADEDDSASSGETAPDQEESQAISTTPSRNNLSTETEDSKAAAKAKSVEEAQEAYEKALAEAEEAAAQLGGLVELQTNLAPYFDQLALATESVDAAAEARKPLDAERAECQETIKTLQAELEDAKSVRAEALVGLLLVDKVLSQAGGDGVLSVIVGVSNATEAEATEYLLERVAVSHAQTKKAADDNVAELEAKLAEAEAHLAEVDEAIDEAVQQKAEAQSALEALVDEGNIAAFEIEKLASQARQASREAATSVENLSDDIEGVDELKKAAAEWDLALNGERAAALDLAGAWYDAVDAIAGLEDGISYGCGLDFALDEKDFVAKWGPAIDAFFVSQGAPLQGYGNEMARQAYTYKVDPRLCAAVSIVESSGGRYCIKPHNAWGWGAADSDPYNLASGWSSWEEAIEAWHYGMATSQTGLATTPSLTAMGDIYCSTPIWGSKVAMLMEQVSGYAQTQQLVVRS